MLDAITCIHTKGEKRRFDTETKGNVTTSAGVREKRVRARVGAFVLVHMRQRQREGETDG